MSIGDHCQVSIVGIDYPDNQVYRFDCIVKSIVFDVSNYEMNLESKLEAFYSLKKC